MISRNSSRVGEDSLILEVIVVGRVIRIRGGGRRRGYFVHADRLEVRMRDRDIGGRCKLRLDVFDHFVHHLSHIRRVRLGRQRLNDHLNLMLSVRVPEARH